MAVQRSGGTAVTSWIGKGLPLWETVSGHPD